MLIDIQKRLSQQNVSISDMTVFMSSASQTESFHLSSWNEMKQKERFNWWLNWRWFIVAKWIDKIVVWKLIQFILFSYSFMFSFLSFISFKINQMKSLQNSTKSWCKNLIKKTKMKWLKTKISLQSWNEWSNESKINFIEFLFSF